MNKSSFWSKLKKKEATKGNKYDNQTSNASINLNSTLFANHSHDHVPEMHNSHRSQTFNNKNNHGNGKTRGKIELDIKYVEMMVSKVKELKRRMHHFESYYINNICHEHVEIGDFERQKPSKAKVNSIASQLIGSYSPGINYRSVDSSRKQIDQRSIYTNNYIVKNTKSEKGKSTASIVMSAITCNKNGLVEILPNSKDFQSAAEEFIQQAEELKRKIGYILNCTGYNIASASEPSMKSTQSDSTVYGTSVCEENVIKSLIDTLSGQYKEILNILLEVDKRLNELSSGNLGKKTKETTITSDASVKRPSNMLKNTSDKNLEPVVMVYEPIQPECVKCKVCRYCGREFGPCVEACRGETVDTNIHSTSTFKSKDSDKNQKVGFVVTYTPDLASQCNAFEDKDDRRDSKKKRPFLWF